MKTLLQFTTILLLLTAQALFAQNATIYYGTSDGKLYAIDVKSGIKKWQVQIDDDFDIGSSITTPAVVNGVLYGILNLKQSQSSFLIALDASTGIKVWETKLNYISTVNNLVVKDNSIYVGAKYYGVSAFDIKSGAKKWERKDIQCNSSPTVFNSTVYINNYQSGILLALDAITGIEKWNFPLGNNSYQGRAVIDVKNKTVFISGRNNSKYLFYALDAESGAKKWEFEPGSPYAPVVSNETAYFGSGSFYALNTQTGVMKWKSNAGTSAFCDFSTEGSISENGIIYAESCSPYALDGNTGETKWFWDFNKRNGISLHFRIIANGSLYCTGGDIKNNTQINIYVLDANTNVIKSTILVEDKIASGNNKVIVVDNGKTYYPVNSGMYEESSTTTTATLTLSQETKNIAQAGETSTLNLTTDNIWTASSNASWLKVSPTSGNAGTNITVNYTVDANTTTDTRTGLITFTAGGLTKTFTVTQAGKSTTGGAQLDLEYTEITKYVSAVGFSSLDNVRDGNFLQIAATQDWVASINVDWIKLSTTSKKVVVSNNRVDWTPITYTVAENISTNQRTGVVTFKTTDGTSRTLTIIQGGKMSSPEVLSITSSSSLTATASNVFSAIAQTDYLTLTSSDNWTATISNAPWLKVSPTSGAAGTNTIITYSADANMSALSREATIIFKKGQLIRAFSLLQNGNADLAPITFSISPASKNINSTTLSDRISLTTSSSWAVESNVDWIKISPPTSGTLSYSSTGTNVPINYTVDENTTNTPRTGTVRIFRSPNSSVNKTFVVTQAGKTVIDPILNVGVDEEIPSNTIYFKREITTNNDWAASVDAAWVKISPNNGNAGTNQVITFSTEINPSANVRLANVTFNSGGLTKGFRIKQAGNIITRQDTLTVNFDGAYKLSNEVYYLDWQGQKDSKIRITTNNTWKITSTPWLQLTPISGNAGTDIVVKCPIAPNQSLFDLIGTVTITAGTLTKTIVMKQYRVSFILLPETTTAPSDGKTDKMNLTSYDKWTSKTNDSWIKISMLSGDVGTNIQVPYTIEPNTTNKSRIGFIYFFPQPDGQGSAFSVKQSSVLPKLSLSTNSLRINNSATTGTVKLTANVDWYIKTDVPWVKSIQPFSGSAGTDILISYSVDANTTASERGASITVIAPYEDANSGITYVNETLRIVQAPLILAVDSEQKFDIPTVLTLYSYPNPAQHSTELRLGLPRTSKAKISIVSENGMIVRSLPENIFKAGWHTLKTDVANLPSGTYFYRFEDEKESKTIKMVVIK